MRTMDLSPFRRSSVGFDRMLDLLDDTLGFETTDYPPYDIIRTGENTFRITLAIAGYRPDQIEIIAQQNVLTVGAKSPADDDLDYLHKGIRREPFERRFNLADYVQVRSASVQDGLLHIELAREVPDAMKPRRIEIRGVGVESARAA